MSLFGVIGKEERAAEAKRRKVHSTKGWTVAVLMSVVCVLIAADNLRQPISEVPLPHILFVDEGRGIIQPLRVAYNGPVSIKTQTIKEAELLGKLIRYLKYRERWHPHFYEEDELFLRKNSTDEQNVVIRERLNKRIKEFGTKVQIKIHPVSHHWMRSTDANGDIRIHGVRLEFDQVTKTKGKPDEWRRYISELAYYFVDDEGTQTLDYSQVELNANRMYVERYDRSPVDTKNMEMAHAN